MFDPLDDPLLHIVAAQKASAIAHALAITAADIVVARGRDQLVRSHPLGRAMLDSHVILEELK